MMSEESSFTQFNISFITFPRQVFVKIFDVLLNETAWDKDYVS